MDVDESPITSCPFVKEGRFATHWASATTEPSQGTPPIWASAKAIRPTQVSPHIPEGSKLVETGRTALRSDDNKAQHTGGEAQ